MKRVRSYRDLLIWQRGIELAKAVYEITRTFPSYERYGLSNQLQRAAVSIPSNIAEGQARQHRREFRRYLRIALGSLAEVDTQLFLAQELGYFSEGRGNEIQMMIVELRKMIFGLIDRLSN